jgi:hypothetical protein
LPSTLLPVPRHLTFVISGLLFASMDWIGNRAEKPKDH